MLIELRRLQRIMRGDDLEEDSNFINLSEHEKSICNNFLEFFAICPTCEHKNHERYLIKFYFDTNPEKIFIKGQLFKLMATSKDFNEMYYNNIRFGIPCCECFKIYFENK